MILQPQKRDENGALKNYFCDYSCKNLTSNYFCTIYYYDEMKFKPEFNSLIIVGNWNNAILNPKWITKYILPETELSVEIPLNINASMRMSTKELRIFSIDGKLNFAVLKHDDTVFKKIGELGIKMADNLIHTPVSAFGINYVFECEGTETIDDLFSLSDSEDIEQNGFAVSNIQIRRQLKSGDKLLNLIIIKSNEKYSFDFNYHTNIKSMVDFKDKFDPDDIVKFKNESIELLSNLYELEMS